MKLSVYQCTSFPLHTDIPSFTFFYVSSASSLQNLNLILVALDNRSGRFIMKTKTKFCQGKDVLERMNYLYQASHLMALKNKVISSYYGNMMVGCAKKAVLRMEPDLKRTLCKSCQTPLISGETARVRLISKPVKGIKWTCLTCMSTKRFPTRKGHKLWLDDPQAIIEILDYTPKSKEENVQQSNSQENTLTDSNLKNKNQDKC